MIKRFGCLLILSALSVFAAGPKEAAVSERMRPVLLVIDVQNQYLQYIDPADKGMGMWVIPSVIQLFREGGFPIIRVYNTDPKWGPAQGTEAFEFPNTIPVTQEDPMVVKNYPNGFKKTPLEKLIRERGCNTVFLCGLSSVGCVLATYQAAVDLDFTAFLVKDGLMSHNASYTNTIEDIFDAVGTEAVKAMLKNAEKPEN
jgi:nicotinamidase-related amidase